MGKFVVLSGFFFFEYLQNVFKKWNNIKKIIFDSFLVFTSVNTGYGVLFLFNHIKAFNMTLNMTCCEITFYFESIPERWSRFVKSKKLQLNSTINYTALIWAIAHLQCPSLFFLRLFCFISYIRVPRQYERIFLSMTEFQWLIKSTIKK